MMATIVATGRKIEGENYTHPVTWDEWITLAIRLRDNAVLSVRGPIRVPTVIMAVIWFRWPTKLVMLLAQNRGWCENGD
jgi:hypothetical protein